MTGRRFGSASGLTSQRRQDIGIDADAIAALQSADILLEKISFQRRFQGCIQTFRIFAGGRTWHDDLFDPRHNESIALAPVAAHESTLRSGKDRLNQAIGERG